MSGIKGLAVAGATVIVLGGGALLGASAAGNAGSICGSSEVAASVAASRVEIRTMPAQLIQAGASLVTSAPSRISTTGSLGAGINCADQVAPVPAVSEQVRPPAWLERELAGGPPHCAVV